MTKDDAFARLAKRKFRSRFKLTDDSYEFLGGYAYRKADIGRSTKIVSECLTHTASLYYCTPSAPRGFFATSSPNFAIISSVAGGGKNAATYNPEGERF